jgi:hypothetical protein
MNQPEMDYNFKMAEQEVHDDLIVHDDGDWYEMTFAGREQGAIGIRYWIKLNMKVRLHEYSGDFGLPLYIRYEHISDISARRIGG